MSEQTTLDEIHKEDKDKKIFTEFKKEDGSASFIRASWAGSNVPDGWTAEVVGNNVKVTGGKAFSSDNFTTNSDEGTPLVKRKTVNNKIQPETRLQRGFDDRYLVKDGDLLVSMDRYFESMLWRYGDAALNQRVCRISTQEKFNSHYLSYAIQKPLKYLEHLGGTTDFTSLSIREFNNIEIPTPPLDEQKKIASVLYNIDESIRKTREITEQVKKAKRGILQDKIFDVENSDVTERRFGPMVFNIPEYWSRVRLEDVSMLVTRGKQPKYAENGIPVINQECIYWDDWYFDNLRYLDEDIAEEWKEKYFPKNDDVLINSTGQGTLGRAQVYPDNERRAVDSHVTIVRPDKGRILPGYVKYFLESNKGQGLLYSMCVTGSTGQIELSKSKLQLLVIPLPPIEEQKEIVETIKWFDSNVRKQQTYSDRLRHLKEGLMQDLLSGTVRTTNTNIEVLPEVEQYG